MKPSRAQGCGALPNPRGVFNHFIYGFVIYFIDYNLIK
jgi:hypothetical protein